MLYGPNWLGDTELLTLPADGTYYLGFEGYVHNSGPFSATFNVQSVDDIISPIAIDTTVNGQIDVPGQRVRHTFTLLNDGYYLFDSLTPTFSFTWSLGNISPIIGDTYFYYADINSMGESAVRFLRAGEYSILVDGSGDVTGEYAFVFRSLSNATQAPLGDEVQVALDPGNESAVYRIAAERGDDLTFSLFGDWRSSNWSLFDPFGRQVVLNSYNDEGPLTALATGNYLLVIEGPIWDSTPAEFSFIVEKVGETAIPDPTGEAINLAELIEGTFPEG
jgi:hypothetical protein